VQLAQRSTAWHVLSAAHEKNVRRAAPQRRQRARQRTVSM
jgi:hypothetical protein